MPDEVTALVAEIRAHDAKATKGPWRYHERKTKVVAGHKDSYLVAMGMTPDEGEFIAFSRTALPRAADLLERQTERIEELEREIAELREFNGNLIEKVAELERQLAEANAQIDGAEEAIAYCPSLKDWGRSQRSNHASRVTYLCNLYASTADTIIAIDEARQTLEREIAEARDRAMDDAIRQVKTAWPLAAAAIRALKGGSR